MHASNGSAVRPRFGRPLAWRREQHEESAHGFFPRGRLGKKIKRAAERVRKVNKKLVAYEKGFLHEEGIKDREWYRHLVVAPGKWLGKAFHR